MAKPFNVEKIVNWTEKQKEADDAVKTHKFVLYGGAMGGGKSYWLRWELIKLLLYWGYMRPKLFKKPAIKGVMVGLFCETFPALKDRHIEKIKREFPATLGYYKATDHNFVLHPRWGGGVLAFRNLDDVSKYQSAEFAAIAVDELTKNKKETFDYLRTRLRWNNIEKPKFIAATNPGSIGSEWVKKLWIKRQFDPRETEQDQFAYIQAKASENPYLAADYEIGLQGLPEMMRKALLEGDWDTFQGQFFTEWSKEFHTCKAKPVLPYYKKFIMGDYGYAKPSAVYWAYLDEDGQLNVYRELYRAGLTGYQLGQEISSMTPANEQIDYCVFDPAMWAKKGEDAAALSTIEQVRNGWKENRGTSMPMVVQGNNDRATGWGMVREYLKPLAVAGKAYPKIQVWETCPKLIETIPSQVFDVHKPEDLDTEGDDHGVDALRYGIMSRPKSTPSIETGIGARLAKMVNAGSKPSKLGPKPTAADQYD